MAIYQVGKFQGPALPQRNIPKNDSVAYLLVSEDLEQDESKEKRDYGLVEVNQSSDISKGINKTANSLGQV